MVKLQQLHMYKGFSHQNPMRSPCCSFCGICIPVEVSWDFHLSDIIVAFNPIYKLVVVNLMYMYWSGWNHFQSPRPLKKSKSGRLTIFTFLTLKKVAQSRNLLIQPQICFYYKTTLPLKWLQNKRCYPLDSDLSGG